MQQSQPDSSALTSSTSRRQALTGALTGLGHQEHFHLKHGRYISESQPQPKLLSRILQCAAPAGTKG